MGVALKTGRRIHRSSPRRGQASISLFSEIQFVDQLFVPFRLGPAQIIEQAPALGDHFKKAAARGVVLGMAFQVFGQLPDPARQQRDLYISAAGVLTMQLELLDIQRFGVLSHFEAPILDEVRRIATAS